MNKVIENRILEFIRSNELLEEGDRVLLGLSGGPDSVFAFHFLLKYRKQLGIEFAALHLNHKLRANESDSDEQFCADLCALHSIKIYVYNADVLELAEIAGCSTEEAARHERYRLFKLCSEENRFTKIVTAHNTDDNTETVFLNLIKGGGATALAGIPIKRNNIIRPFLCVTKAEILDSLEENGIEFRLDSSNLDSKYERNFLRNEILPRIKEKINPRLDAAVFNSSQILSNLYAMVSGDIDSAYENCIENGEGFISIRNRLFRENQFVIGEVLKKLFTDELRIEFNTASFKMLTELNLNQVGSRNQLKDNWFAVRERDSIDILIPKEKVSEDIQLRAGESIRVGDSFISIEEVSPDDILYNSDKKSEYISADNLDDIFILRKWKSGDVFNPLGMRGQKNVSDFLTDIKISNKLRSEVYVLLNRNKIVWLVGLRINENFKINKSTKRIFKICLK